MKMNWTIEEGAQSGRPAVDIYDALGALTLDGLRMGKPVSLDAYRAKLGHESGNAAGTALGRGVNGRGFRFYRDRAKRVIACRENAKLSVQRMSDEAVAKWCEAQGMTIEEMVAWIESLPSR